MNQVLLKALLCLPLPIVTLILEFLPNGAVYNVAEEPGEVLLETFSYFDTTHFGLTNFAPLFTAIATCVALLMLGVYCGTRWHWFANAAKHFVFGGVAFSVIPLLFAVHAFPAVGAWISATLIAELALIHFLVGEPKTK